MRHFQDQLAMLLQKVVVMGSLAEDMIHTAAQILAKQAEKLSADVYSKEQRVNALQVEVDDLAVTLTALNQPVARDARFLFMVSRIAGELERIADQAINICQNSHFVLAPSQPQVDMPQAGLADISVMAEVAQKMVRDSLTAMMNKDVALADRVLADDEQVDGFRDRIFRSLLTHMIENPGTIQRAMSMILIARNLERIADHATNIGEEVIYWIQGRDVRHTKGLTQQPRKQNHP